MPQPGGGSSAAERSRRAPMRAPTDPAAVPNPLCELRRVDSCGSQPLDLPALPTELFGEGRRGGSAVPLRGPSTSWALRGSGELTTVPRRASLVLASWIRVGVGWGSEVAQHLCFGVWGPFSGPGAAGNRSGVKHWPGWTPGGVRGPILSGFALAPPLLTDSLGPNLSKLLPSRHSRLIHSRIQLIT